MKRGEGGGGKVCTLYTQALSSVLSAFSHTVVFLLTPPYSSLLLLTPPYSLPLHPSSFLIPHSSFLLRPPPPPSVLLHPYSLFLHPSSFLPLVVGDIRRGRLRERVPRTRARACAGREGRAAACRAILRAVGGGNITSQAHTPHRNGSYY